MEKSPFSDIIKVATALEGGADEIVFVGASVLSLYVKDDGGSTVRQTFDVDVVLHMATRLNAESIRLLLVSRGFRQSAEDAVVCRFRLNDVMVDILSTAETAWIPSNRWFLPGLDHAVELDCEGVRIKVLSLPYYIAAKWDAFESRGGSDPRFSQDFEDIAWLIDHVDELPEQIERADSVIRNHLVEIIGAILRESAMLEALESNMEASTRTSRYASAVERLRRIVGLGSR